VPNNPIGPVYIKTDPLDELRISAPYRTNYLFTLGTPRFIICEFHN
jgi:hypothetical protein